MLLVNKMNFIWNEILFGINPDYRRSIWMTGSQRLTGVTLRQSWGNKMENQSTGGCHWQHEHDENKAQVCRKGKTPTVRHLADKQNGEGLPNMVKFQA